VSAAVLNAVMRVYVAAGALEHAAGMLEQFRAFGQTPTAATFEILLRSYSGDIGRFFALWDECVETGVVIDSAIVHLALDLAMESQSSRRVVMVLDAMLSRGERPLPAAAEKLAVVGRQVAQIHEAVGRLVAQQRDEAHAARQKEHALLSLDMEEYRTRIASSDGKTDMELVTPRNETWVARGKRPRLARKDHLEVKKKGGAMHALRVDKPRPNLLY
jgi:hypothetical protein